MKAFIVSFILATTIVTNAKSAETKKFYVAGPGIMTCREYTSLSDNNKKEELGWIFFWVQGYMSGVNLSVIEASKDKKVGVNLTAMETEEQELFLRIYCRKHDNDKIYMAADSLMLRLDNE